MGHIVNNEREYRLLQQRLDYNLTGAPASPVFISILKMLFTRQEAEIARQIPLRPTRITDLAPKLGMPVKELYARITDMAERGLVFDLEHKGECYIVLAPVVIGFFEFIFMRTRDELPMGDLARLFETYMFQDDRFARSVFTGTTQLGRSLVREEALPAENYSEVLDWEKASAVVESASAIGLSLCACRHKAEHLGKSCKAPQRTCFTLNTGAEMLIKRGMAEAITSRKAMEILMECKQAGLAQIADNVQNHVGFICNCCGCCCGMIQAIKTFDIRNAVVTSNWLVEVEAAACIGCGACLRACPVEALIPGCPVACEKDLCLGCGVCYSACKLGAIRMVKREQRVLVPETTFDKFVAMAIERGKLSYFLFDDPSRLSHRTWGRIASVIERSAPVQALLAVKPLRSAFLSAIAKSAKKQTEG